MKKYTLFQYLWDSKLDILRTILWIGIIIIFIVILYDLNSQQQDRCDLLVKEGTYPKEVCGSYSKEECYNGCKKLGKEYFVTKDTGFFSSKSCICKDGVKTIRIY